MRQAHAVGYARGRVAVNQSLPTPCRKYGLSSFLQHFCNLCGYTHKRRFLKFIASSYRIS